MAAARFKVPYTQQFAPAVTPLRKLIGVLRGNHGKPDSLLKGIASACFATSKSPAKMAGNTIIALKYHRIIDDQCNPAELGDQILRTKDDTDAVALVAKNILLNLDGIHIVETLREMKQGGGNFTLGGITDELRQRGFEVSDNSSDLSGVFGWLREARVLTNYDVNDDKYAELVGASLRTIEALKDLSEGQIGFLRAIVSIGGDDWIPHNTVVQHAEALYSGQVQFNWKDLDRSILRPLKEKGLIDIQKAPKASEGARGGKAALVKPTKRFETEIAEPILAPLYKAAGFRDLRKIRSTSFVTLVTNIKQKTDDALRGEALEILAIRICQLLDLDFMGWRETDEEVVAGGEVDGFMHTARLVYSRWQIQCKASDRITYEALAKEVGVAEVTLANVILAVSTGTTTKGADTYRQRIISKTPLNIVIIDGPALDKIVQNPAAITEILRAQAHDAMRMKPAPAHLLKDEPDDDGGGGGIPAKRTSPDPKTPTASKRPGKQSDNATLFKPYHSSSAGTMYLGNAHDVLRFLIDQGVRVKLLFTSPPFALLRKKEYGNEDAEQYVAWFMQFAPLFAEILEPGGSFVMDIGGSWLPGIPARSTYHYKLLIRLCESGFYLAQEFFHYNPARLPTPAEWVTVRRLRVKDAVNNVWWFVKEPFVESDNRRVLREYSDSMKALLRNGYKPKLRPSGHDISNKFGVDHGGSIPSNVLEFSNTESNSYYLKACRSAGIKPHPARFPIALPRFFLRFLTSPGDTVLDPFAGSNVTGEAAELLGRRWIGIEINEEYVKGSRFRFDRPFTQPKAVPIAPRDRRDSEQPLFSDFLTSRRRRAVP